jgi:hypothetical protein
VPPAMFIRGNIQIADVPAYRREEGVAWNLSSSGGALNFTGVNQWAGDVDRSVGGGVKLPPA